ncbi:MAG: protein translocase subunit SecF [Spirochaetales bacterium]|nr:protein translocase subunit SecF [Spirochaetales bacterium]
MKNIVNFTKLRFIMFVLSILLIIGGLVGTAVQGGFNFGIDFQAGLSQRVQIAPAALEVRYTGSGDVRLNMNDGTVIIELRDAEGVRSWTFPADEYTTVQSLAQGLQELENITAEVVGSGNASTESITTGLGLPFELMDSEDVARLNVKNTDSASYIGINEVRNALQELSSLQVQVVGAPHEQEFLIRTEDDQGGQKEALENKLSTMLGEAFGEDDVLIKRSDYVGPRFSADLAQQSIVLVIAALVLILAYVWFRFRLGFAISSITALAHDILIMVGFIGVSQLEVNTATIAAVLTIIGYSLNDTIVVFDRVRENTSLMVDRPFETVINASITQSLSRTLITSLTTLLAVLALYIFGTGSIQDFALNLIVGIFIGTYSSIFIASPVLLAWTNSANRKKAEHLGSSSSAEKAKKTAEVQDTRSAKSADTSSEKASAKKTVLKESASVPKVERKQKGKRQEKKKKKS